MTARWLTEVAAGLLLIGSMTGAGEAQSTRSQMSARAQATIVIRASVRPMFTLSAPTGPLNVSSNTGPDLRYSVTVEPTSGSIQRLDGAELQSTLRAQDAEGKFTAGREQLVLIVPD